MQPKRIADRRFSLIGLFLVIGVVYPALGQEAAMTPPHAIRRERELLPWSPGPFPCECLENWVSFSTITCNPGSSARVTAYVPRFVDSTPCYTCGRYECIHQTDPCPCLGLGRSTNAPSECNVWEEEVTTTVWMPTGRFVFCIKCVPLSCLQNSPYPMMSTAGRAASSWSRVKATYR